MNDHVQGGPDIEFSDRELKLIAAAERRIRNALCFRCVCALMLLINVGLFMAGYMSEDQMIMFTVAIVLAAAVYPRWGARTPSYEQLVDILVDKSSTGRRVPLTEALTRKQSRSRLGGKHSR